MNCYRYPSEREWSELLKRPAKESGSLNATVQAVLDDIKQRGDEAVREYEARFDHVTLHELQVSEA